MALSRRTSNRPCRFRCTIPSRGRNPSGLALIGAVVAEFVAGTGGRSAGLAYEILQSGFQLDIPRMFAALFLITLAGVGLFTLMTGLSKLALAHWHESELGAET